MGAIVEPEKAVLICGLLAGDEAVLAAAGELLKHKFGAIESVSDTWPFANTQYYERELGPSILRRFVSFSAPFARDSLADVKRISNALEAELSEQLGRTDGLRAVNIDPGYIHLGGLVLATTKDRAHRIYLGQGIYAEVTLVYEQGRWRAWPWTYPDYAADTYHGFLSLVREKLKSRRRGSEDFR
jgi:hypothetical protein